MKKPKIGDYVLTCHGDIAKIKRIKKIGIKNKIYEFDTFINIGYMNTNFLSDKDFKNNIVFYNSNILEILNGGDFINGYKIIDFQTRDGKRENAIAVSTSPYVFDYDKIKFYKNEIFNVMTYTKFYELSYKKGID